MKKKILVRGPALSQTGYGEQCRFALRALRSREDLFDIYLLNIPWGQSNWIFENNEERKWLDELIIKSKPLIQNQAANPQTPVFDLSLQVTIPNELQRMAPQNILYTAGIETDQACPEWIGKCHQFADKILTISNHAKYGFQVPIKAIDESGKEIEFTLQKPIEVVHYPTKKIKTKKLNLDLKTNFNFLVMSQWGPRKNISNTIDWFCKEFQSDKNVGLVIKTFARGNSQIDKNYVENAIKEITDKHPDRKCKVYVLHGYMNEQELHSLYTDPKIKAIINFGHGEGYGLPLFEAAYSGLPVITHDFGGQKDFLYAPKKNKKGVEKLRPHFSKIDYRLDQVQKEVLWKGVIEPNMQWAYPNESSCKVAMREAVNNYGLVKGEAKRLKTWIEKEFSEEQKYHDFVVSLLGQQEYNEMTANIIDVVALKEEVLSIESVKERSKRAQEALQTLSSQKEKIDFLKDLFKGEKCYVLSCGPTLTEHPEEKIKALCENSLTLSVKQAYNMFEQETDFHVYNCANFKNYDYSNHRPIVAEASTTPFKLGECDLKFFIRERNFDNSISSKKNFDDWTLENNTLLRPFGPGIMYEMVFYLLEHLGVSEIITIGWDNKLLDDDPLHGHFYDMKGSGMKKEDFIDSNDVAENENSAKSLKYEEKLTVGAIQDWYNWLKSKDTVIKIVSTKSENPAPKEIERVKI
tara:strand:- start:1403 stop:3478 length:2076 start_codon:yes stop_codon:yes gene_type:complete